MGIEGHGGDATEQPGAQTPTDARVEVRREASGAVVCRLAGDLDLDSLAAPQKLLEETVRAGVPLLAVDLRDVTFCDSSALNMLLQIRLTAQEAGVVLELGPISAPVARLLEITGASQVFSFRSATGDVEPS